MKKYLVTFEYYGGGKIEYMIDAPSEGEAFSRAIIKADDESCNFEIEQTLAEIQANTISVIEQTADAKTVVSDKDEFIGWIMKKAFAWDTAPNGTATKNIGKTIIEHAKQFPKLKLGNIYLVKKNGSFLVDWENQEFCYVLNKACNIAYGLYKNGSIKEYTYEQVDNTYRTNAKALKQLTINPFSPLQTT